MALEPAKEEKIEDLSFLTRKRNPKMKEPGQVKSPFSNLDKSSEEETPSESHLDKSTQIDSILNAPSVATKPKKKIKREINEDTSKNRTNRDLQLSKEDLQNLILKAGPDKAAYALLLKTLSDEMNHISISYRESSKLFGLKSEKSSKGILSSLEKAGLLKLKCKADVSQGKPTTYHLHY